MLALMRTSHFRASRVTFFVVSNDRAPPMFDVTIPCFFDPKFADATGDRRADAIVVNDDRVTVRRSR
jgi:hypothetical protein